MLSMLIAFGFVGRLNVRKGEKGRKDEGEREREKRACIAFLVLGEQIETGMNHAGENLFSEYVCLLAEGSLISIQQKEGGKRGRKQTRCTRLQRAMDQKRVDRDSHRRDYQGQSRGGHERWREGC